MKRRFDPGKGACVYLPAACGRSTFEGNPLGGKLNGFLFFGDIQDGTDD
jgi:hypothetical protein